jgi:hypothetical protein
MCKRGEERAEEERLDAWLFIDGPRNISSVPENEGKNKSEKETKGSQVLL